MGKAQTALEYLMTYGWAILIVVIVIGALYALGLTKPCKWVGTQVREFADFRVENVKFAVGATNYLSFDFSRVKPDQVELAGGSISGDATGGTLTPAPGTPINSTKVRYTFSGISTTKPVGDCYSVDVVIRYNVTVAGGVEETFTTSGKISGVVEAA